MNAKVGSFGISTESCNLEIADVGFQPEALIFWWNGQAASGLGAGHAFPGFGFCTSATERAAITGSVEDGSVAGDVNLYHTFSACVALQQISGNVNGLLDLVTLDAGGFTLAVDNQSTTDYLVHYLALGGDITGAKVGTFNCTTATGTQNVTGVGFQPEFVLFATPSDPQVSPNSAARISLAIGAATGPSNEGVISLRQRDNLNPSQCGAYGFSDECIANPYFSGGLRNRAEFTSFLADGFQINWLEAISSYVIFYLALAGGDYHVGETLTRTDTSEFSETGLGFAPAAAMFLSNCRAEDTQDTESVEQEWSVGAVASTTNRAAQGHNALNGVSPSSVWSIARNDAVYAHISTAGAVDGLMDVVSLDADGFTLVMDDADPSAAFVGYIAFGPAEAGAADGYGPRGLGRGILRGVHT
jgi:hypothetical protein